MQKEVLDHLVKSAEEFLVSLRTGDGFDETKFENLCAVLRRCRDEWANAETIPKQVVAVLVDLYPLTHGCSELYKGAEAEKIIKAAYDLEMLISDAVGDWPGSLP